MSESCVQISANAVYLSCALAVWQVVFKKLLNYLLVKAMDIESALGRPVRKVCYATDIGINGLGGVAPLGEMIRESINVRR
jgi:hypothetical protein